MSSSSMPLLQLQHESINQNFGDRVRGAESSSDNAHRPVAVSAQSSLNDGKADLAVANPQRLQAQRSTVGLWSGSNWSWLITGE